MGHSNKEISTQNIFPPKEKISYAYQEIINFSNKEISTPKIYPPKKTSYTYGKNCLKKQIFNRKKKFLMLTQENTIFYPERKFLILTLQKSNFSNKKNSFTYLITLISHPKKTFLILSKKEPIFQMKKMLCLLGKTDFPNEKNFL